MTDYLGLSKAELAESNMRALLQTSPAPPGTYAYESAPVVTRKRKATKRQ